MMKALKRRETCSLPPIQKKRGKTSHTVQWLHRESKQTCPITGSEGTLLAGPGMHI